MTSTPPGILQLGMHYDPAGGGADRYFSGLLSGLEANGTQFRAAAFGVPPRTGERVSLGPVKTGLLQRLRAIRRFGSEELASSEVFASHFALYAFPLLDRLRSTAHVVHFHGPWADESAGEGQNARVVAMKRWVENRVYRSATRFIVLSGAFRDVLISSYGIAPEKVSIIPGGVEVERFRPSATRQEARRRMGWPEDRKIILCVRRLVRRMGLETLLEAFANVASTSRDAHLVIAGRGALAEDLRTQAGALGLRDRVTFAGFIPDDDLPTAYGAADFSIVPSQALEGFGLITLESLACGTPVLVTPVGGLPDAVRGLSQDLILKDSSRNALVEGLHRGLEKSLPSPEACRAYVEQSYSWPAIARRVAAVYEEAIHDRAR